jgi:hypothetical protein
LIQEVFFIQIKQIGMHRLIRQRRAF